MAKQKQYFKKLTYAGGSLCALSFIALLLSLAASLLEPAGVVIYNEFFDREVDHIFSPDVYTFVYIHSSAFVTAAFSAAAFFTCAGAGSKKKLGGSFAGTLIAVPLAAAVSRVFGIVEMLDDGSFSNAMSYGSDGDKFRAVLSLLEFALPLVACFLLFIGGLVLAGRLMGEDFFAEIPLRVKGSPENAAAPVPAPDVSEQPQPYIQPDVTAQFRKPDGAEPVMAHAEPQRTAQPEIAGQSEQTPVQTEAVLPEAERSEQRSAAEEPKCPHCGSELKEGARFCSVCGKQVLP